jgi:cyanophycinase-like exopeptidase
MNSIRRCGVEHIGRSTGGRDDNARVLGGLKCQMVRVGKSTLWFNIYDVFQGGRRVLGGTARGRKILSDFLILGGFLMLIDCRNGNIIKLL